MAQAATITVNDRTPVTPVAHAYTPKEKLDTGFLFREAAAVPAGDRLLSIRKREGEQGKTYVRLVLTNPVLVNETINGVTVPTVHRVSLVDCTFRFEASSTEQERADTVGMFANALAAAQTVVNSTVVKLEGVW